MPPPEDESGEETTFGAEVIEGSLSGTKAIYHLFIPNSHWFQSTSTSQQEKSGCRIEIWISLIVLQDDRDFHNKFNILDIRGITDDRRALKPAIGLDNLFSKVEKF